MNTIIVLCPLIIKFYFILFAFTINDLQNINLWMDTINKYFFIEAFSQKKIDIHRQNYNLN